MKCTFSFAKLVWRGKSCGPPSNDVTSPTAAASKMTKLVVLFVCLILGSHAGAASSFRPLSQVRRDWQTTARPFPLVGAKQTRMNPNLSGSSSSNNNNNNKHTTFNVRGGGATTRGAAVTPLFATLPPVLLSKSSWIATWAVAVGGFLVRNYKTKQPWPTLLTTGSRRGWNFVHAVSSTIFAGTILTTTLVEWLVVRAAHPAVMKFWFSTIPSVDVAVVLPALTGAMISGVAQSIQEYGRVVEAPKYVKAVLHTLATFGLWWAATDRPTQRGATKAVETWLTMTQAARASSSFPRILQWRRASNIISCLFVLALYILMVLKPGRPDLPPIR